MNVYFQVSRWNRYLSAEEEEEEEEEEGIWCTCIALWRRVLGGYGFDSDGC